jgi:hypothetical protein
MGATIQARMAKKPPSSTRTMPAMTPIVLFREALSVRRLDAGPMPGHRVVQP